jgi:hypothetical protein
METLVSRALRVHEFVKVTTESPLQPRRISMGISAKRKQKS